MHWLDIVLLAILLFSAFQGSRRGLINTVLSIIGVIAGIILAGRFYDDVSAWFGFADNAVFNLISFLAIIGLVMLAAAIIAKMLKLAVSVVLLGWIDHLGGIRRVEMRVLDQHEAGRVGATSQALERDD